MSEATEAAGNPPGRYKTPLKYRRQFEFILPVPLAQYHGFDKNEDTTSDLYSVGYMLTQQGESLGVNLKANIMALKARTQSVVVQGEGKVTVRFPGAIASAAGFDQLIEDGKTVDVVVESTAPGEMSVSFVPPITPIQVPTDGIEASERMIVSNPGGEQMEGESHRLYFSQDWNEVFREFGYVGIQFAVADGELGLHLDLTVSESESDRLSVRKARINPSSGTRGRQYYVTLPKQLVATLNWIDQKVRVFSHDEGLTVIPAND